MRSCPSPAFGNVCQCPRGLKDDVTGSGETSSSSWNTQGFATIDIADHLAISVHTVQGQLRNIFTKIGVRSRRDLVTKIFFGHYEPRVRDNEQRTSAHQPLRGGPAAATSPHPRARIG
jgi:hypothetical protein